MPTIVAAKAYPYGSLSLKVGEAFEATEKDAGLLLKLGLATAHPLVDELHEHHSTDVVDRLESAPAKRRYRRREPSPDA